MKKGITRLFAAFFLCLTPLLALAQSVGTTIDMSDAAITDGATGTGWTYASANGGVYTIQNGADVTVIGNNQSPGVSQRRLAVATGAAATITLSGVSITGTGASPLLLNNSANVTLVLRDGTTNTLTSGSEGGAGIQTTNATLTINAQAAGTGGLIATGMRSGAGIGGGSGGVGGSITINGGTVTANGSASNLNGSAGIGGGSGGAGGSITINGGTVMATGGGTTGAGGYYGYAGAGIGGGDAGAGGTIIITGGTVTAISNNSAAGIGGGRGGNSGIIEISGNANVTASGGAGGRSSGGAGIGSGSTGNSTVLAVNSITITTTGTVTATGGAGYNNYGTGAAIGQGGYYGGDGVPVLPSVPQNFTVTTGSTQATLAWSAPALPIRGIAITGYQVSSNDGMTWTNASSMTGHTFSDLTNGTTYTFRVRATFNYGFGMNASTSATVGVEQPVAVSPTITSASSMTLTSGTGGTFQVAASGTAPITYGLTGQPAGVTINSATGAITIAATTAAGNHTFIITASNGVSPSYSQSFTLNITSSSPPPNITSANSTTVISGTSSTFQVTATGSTPITYALSGQPAGVSINSTTGVITIAATTAVGNHHFSIRATNGINPDYVQSFTLLVNPAIGANAFIQKAYLAFFNRPADVPGMDWWKEYPGDMQDLLDLFATSEEYLSDYAGKTNQEILAIVYRNLFGRDPEPAGLAYWSTQMDAGWVTIANVAYEVLGGAQGTDMDTINNKVHAADMFTNALDTPQKVNAYNNAGDNGLGHLTKEWLAAVDERSESVGEAQTKMGALINTLVAGNSGG